MAGENEELKVVWLRSYGKVENKMLGELMHFLSNQGAIEDNDVGEIYEYFQVKFTLADARKGVTPNAVKLGYVCVSS